MLRPILEGLEHDGGFNKNYFHNEELMLN